MKAVAVGPCAVLGDGEKIVLPLFDAKGRSHLVVLPVFAAAQAAASLRDALKPERIALPKRHVRKEKHGKRK